MLRHLEEVTFAESTIELCDDKPSIVELQGNQLRRRTLLSVGSYDSRRRSDHKVWTRKGRFGLESGRRAPP